MKGLGHTFWRPALSVIACVFTFGACGGGSGGSNMGMGGDVTGQPSLDYPSYRAIHESIVTPACGPRGGVCHNSKQFPDLHTPDNMLTAIGARCNQLTDDPTSIQDLCEPQGDLLVLKSGPDMGFRTRIGYSKPVDMASPPQSVLLMLHDATPNSATGVDASILRDLDPNNAIEIPIGKHVTTQAGQKSATVTGFAALASSLRAFLFSTYAPGSSGQLFMGDPNQDGLFGFDQRGAVIEPGQPDKSFLVQRILGIVPPKMPLANGDLSDEQIYALECWIAQMKPDGSNADGPIDYTKCPAKF